MKKILLFTLILLSISFASASDIVLSPSYSGFLSMTGINFYGNGAPYGYTNPIGTFRLDNEGTYNLEFSARETHAGNDYAKLNITIDNISTIVSITTTTYSTYFITGKFEGESHNLSITFINDYCVSPCVAPKIDRNVYVDKVILHGNFNLLNSAKIDFSTNEKIIKLDYGLNSKNTPWNYYNDTIAIQRFRDLQTKYFRIWIMDDYYWGNWSSASGQTSFRNWMPINNSGKYNYDKIDMYVSSVLKNVSATPYISLVWCPYWMSERNYGREYSGPANYEACSDYMANVIIHFYDKCNNEWNYCGDFKKWMFGVYNEPDCAHNDSGIIRDWTGYNQNNITGLRNYSRLFNMVYEKAKAKAPTAQIGGFDACGYVYDKMKIFLEQTNTDFVNYHTYAKNTEIYYKSSNNLSALIMSIKGHSLPIVVGEHNMNGSWNPGADSDIKSQYGSVYMASTLNWMVRSETDVELFFETEYGNSDAVGNTAFNLWYRSNIPKPYYYTRMWFVNNIKKGDIIVKSSVENKNVEVLATNKKILLVINKLNTTQIVNITFNEKVYKLFKINDNTTQIINSKSAVLNLNGYDVNFYKIQKDNTNKNLIFIIIAIILLLAYNSRKKIKRFFR